MSRVPRTLYPLIVVGFATLAAGCGSAAGSGDEVTLTSSVTAGQQSSLQQSFVGVIVNLSGQVIGIPTLAALDPAMGAEAPGIGFAIDSNTVRRVADLLVASR